MAADHTGALTDSVWSHSLSGELAPHSNAAGINMYPHSGHFLTPSGSIAHEPRPNTLNRDKCTNSPQDTTTP